MGVEQQDFTMDGNIPTSAHSSAIVEVPRADASPSLPAGMGAVHRARAANRVSQAAEADANSRPVSQEQLILSVPSVRRTLFVRKGHTRGQ